MRGRGVIAGLLAVCGAVALSGPAHAQSISDMIGIGKALCHDLRSGTTPPVVLGKLRSTGFAPAESAIILMSAVDNMCLDAKPAVVGWARDNGYTRPVQGV